MEVMPVITPDRKSKRQNGRWFKEDGEPMFTLNAQDKQGIIINTLTEAQGRQGSSSEFFDLCCKVGRRLTPKECFRLMGFFDDEINLEGISNTQRYKLAGNGWDINLVSKILHQMCNKENKSTKEFAE